MMPIKAKIVFNAIAVFVTEMINRVRELAPKVRKDLEVSLLTDSLFNKH